MENDRSISTQSATILIADDVAANRMVLERHLKRLGHTVLVAEHGQAALELLHQHTVDLLLLDIMMPVMNGYELLALLKSDPALRHLPVVVVSAVNDVESIARCISLGAEDFLFKPIDRVLLEARVEASLARKRMHDREQSAYAAVEAANRTKSEFVSLVAHELRNPLTGLIGYVDLLVHEGCGSANPAQQLYISHIRALISHMTNLLKDLADLSKIETGTLNLVAEAVSLADGVDGAVHALQQQLDTRDQQLQVDLPDTLVPVLADPVRLVQILTNLLSNACKYSPPGGTIRVSAHLRDPLTVEVQVRDNGIGIKPTDQERVFEKFFRSADAQVVKEQGSGLGLNITRHLVELHGGTIGLESMPGSGTTVTFTLLTAG